MARLVLARLAGQLGLLAGKDWRTRHRPLTRSTLGEVGGFAVRRIVAPTVRILMLSFCSVPYGLCTENICLTGFCLSAPKLPPPVAKPQKVRSAGVPRKTASFFRFIFLQFSAVPSSRDRIADSVTLKSSIFRTILCVFSQRSYSTPHTYLSRKILIKNMQNDTWVQINNL